MDGAGDEGYNRDKLYKILCTFERKYGCRFLFCEKKDTGKRIIELLGGDCHDQ